MIKIPTTASQKIQDNIKKGYLPDWNFHPKNRDEWLQWVNQIAVKTEQEILGLCDKLAVNFEQDNIAGVNVYWVMPDKIPPENQNKLLIHFHGGGFVLNPGKAALPEAIMMAGCHHFKVLCLDYKMLPDFTFPTSLNDVFSVYLEIIKSYLPKQIALFGTSAGGNLILSLLLKLKSNQVSLPAVIGLGTPWTDMTKTGDSYFTLEGVDNILVSYDGWLSDAAKLYANGIDLMNPYLSPIYGDLSHLPPMILFAGSRDLFLSNTIRLHLKLRELGGIADLILLEGVSHSQYLIDIDMPEARIYFRELNQFFRQYLVG